MMHPIRFGGTLLGLLVWTAIPAQAVEKEAVQKAIERGVAALQRIQLEDWTWPRHEVGATALAGLTLLECDVPPSNPSVLKAANSLRLASVELTHTYSLSLAILFFDRLKDPNDAILIQTMAIRLLAGQNSLGGWTYHCPRITGDEEIQRLTTLVKKRIELTTRTELPKPKPVDPPDRSSPPVRRERPAVPEQVQRQLDLLNQRQPKPLDATDDNFSGLGDNSNTQFATLALWAARKHGMPVEKALARLETRFRRSQNPDGGWPYLPLALRAGGRDDSTAAMTCAGLLGLALAHGNANEAAGKVDPKRDFAKDPAIRAGLLALGTCIGNPIGRRQPGVLPQAPILHKGYYFLWSVERVAVAFDLKTIGNKDWYAWGADILLTSQQPEGNWQGENGADVDTCFALLFLKRANLAGDLTAMLRGKVRDPGEVTLTSGGVGGTALAKRGIKTGLDFKDKPATDPSNSRPSTEQQKLNAEIARLAAELTEASVSQQDKVLEKLRDGKGVVYTQALALAIPKLMESPRKKAREALADRMTRMTAATLRDKLQDENSEIRRAAALACAMKDDKTHIPDLITALEDQDPLVTRASLATLKSLTGQDFGPAADTTRAQRVKAVADWKNWWNNQARK